MARSAPGARLCRWPALHRILAAARTARGARRAVERRHRPALRKEPFDSPAVSKTKTKANPPAPLAAAAAVAERYCGAAPCNGQVKLIARQPLATGLGVATDAWVTFDSSLGANNLAAPASGYTKLHDRLLGGWAMADSEAMRADWNTFCTTMTHELGHLLGHSQNSTPGSVMAPMFNDHSSVTPPCRSTRPARSARHHH